jgi:hypothetical protein
MYYHDKLLKGRAWASLAGAIVAVAVIVYKLVAR